MKRSVMTIGIVLLLALALGTWAEVTPDALIQAVDQMTPEQVHAFRQKLDARLWDRLPEGFFGRMAVDIGMMYSAVDSLEYGTLAFAGGDMDLDSVEGMDVGVLWRACKERFRLGVRMGSWTATDSNLAEDGYTRVELSGGSISLAAQYQWIRSDSWLLWTELAPGTSAVTLETVNTPVGEATTLHTFDGDFGHLDVVAGVSWRMNRVLSLFLAGGYRFAESMRFEEGGSKTDLKLDASGFTAKLGLGINF